MNLEQLFQDSPNIKLRQGLLGTQGTSIGNLRMFNVTLDGVSVLIPTADKVNGVLGSSAWVADMGGGRMMVIATSGSGEFGSGLEPDGPLGDHIAASDPHSQYLTSAEGNAAYLQLTGGTLSGPVITTTPTLGGHAINKTYGDGLITAHLADGNPHTQYALTANTMTQAAADIAYVNVTGDTLSGHLLGITPALNAHLTRKDYVDGLMATHVGLIDPHPQYLTEADVLTPAQADLAYVNVSGDVMTGPLTTIAPTVGGHAVNRTYADGLITTHVGLIDPHPQYYKAGDAIEWADINSKPDPTITLAGDLDGVVTLTDLTSATLIATINANSVALGTDTVGSYIATLAGTANQVTVAGSGLESAAVTLSLPQNIHTAATPTFTSLTLSQPTGFAPFTIVSSTLISNLNADLLDGQHGAFYQAWANITGKPSPVITLAGDLTGSVTLTSLANGTLTATIAANAVALGTDTTGNYVASVAGTVNQITVTGSGAESAAITLALPQDIGTASNPTFDLVTSTAVMPTVAAHLTRKDYVDTGDANSVAALNAHINDILDAHAATAVSYDGTLLSPISKLWHPDTIVNVQNSLTTIIAEIDGRIEAGDTTAIIDAINNWNVGEPQLSNSGVFTANVIVTEAIAAGAVIASKIAANTITAAQIAATTITATQIAANTITAGQIDATSIRAAILTADVINSTMIQAGTIVASDIAAGTITATQIAANTITAAKIAANTITATEINAASIRAAVLIADSITSAMIVAGTITASDIAAGTITATQIATDTITANQIAANAITVTELAAGSVTAAKIVAGTITGTEISATTTIIVGTLLNNKITLTGTGAGTTTTLQMGTNTGYNTGGGVYIDGSGRFSLGVNQLRWDGVTLTVSDSVIVSSINSGTTLIQGGKIVADSITATQIATDAITANELSANSVTAAKIVAASITGDRMVANTITATQIAANAITASELAVTTQGANLVANWSFEDADFAETWKVVEGVGTNASVITGDANAPSTKVMQITTAANAWGFKAVPIIPGRTYQVSCLIRTDAGATGNYYFRNNWKTDVPASGFVGASDRNGYTPTMVEAGDKASIASATVWTPLTFAWTAPAGARWMSTAFYNYTGTGNMYVDSVVVQEQFGSTYISGGAITTEKIASLAITADKIAANTIDATKINATSIRTAVLTADSITSVMIAADQVTADEIAANTITSAEIQAGSITGDRISASTSIVVGTGTYKVMAIGGAGISTYLGVTSLAAPLYGNVNTPFYVGADQQLSIGDKLLYTGGSLSITGSVTATSGQIGGLTIGPSKIYVGAGNFNNADTAFYVDNVGNLSLKNGFSWNGSTVAVQGLITAVSFEILDSLGLKKAVFSPASLAYDQTGAAISNPSAANQLLFAPLVGNPPTDARTVAKMYFNNLNGTVSTAASLNDGSRYNQLTVNTDYALISASNYNTAPSTSYSTFISKWDLAQIFARGGANATNSALDVRHNSIKLFSDSATGAPGNLQGLIEFRAATIATIGNSTISGTLVASGGSTFNANVTLNSSINVNNNAIQFNSVIGNKLNLYGTEYKLGIASGTLFYDSQDSHKFYSNGAEKLYVGSLGIYMYGTVNLSGNTLQGVGGFTASTVSSSNWVYASTYVQSATEVYARGGIRMGNWSANGQHGCIEGYYGYLLLGAGGVDGSCYLRGTNNGYHLYLKSQGGYVRFESWIKLDSMNGGANYLAVDGNGYMYTAASRRELKEEIIPLPLDTGAIIDALEPVQFIFKNLHPEFGELTPEADEWRRKDIKYGFIVEDVAAVNEKLAIWDLPKRDVIDENGYPVMDPDDPDPNTVLREFTGEIRPNDWDHKPFIAVMIKELQDLRRRVAELEGV